MGRSTRTLFHVPDPLLHTSLRGSHHDCQPRPLIPSTGQTLDLLSIGRLLCTIADKWTQVQFLVLTNAPQIRIWNPCIGLIILFHRACFYCHVSLLHKYQSFHPSLFHLSLHLLSLAISPILLIASFPIPQVLHDQVCIPIDNVGRYLLGPMGYPDPTNFIC